MTEKPFVHKSALVNVKANFIFQDEIADVIFKILNKKGILNIGGKIQSIYDFAKKHGSVKKSFLKKGFPKNPSMNITKFKKSTIV
jgi:dTDP-4-dehydrorhamnose reductase